MTAIEYGTVAPALSFSSTAREIENAVDPGNRSTSSLANTALSLGADVRSSVRTKRDSVPVAPPLVSRKLQA